MVRAVESLPRPFPSTKKLLAMFAAIETAVKIDDAGVPPAAHGYRRPFALAAEYAAGKTIGRWPTMSAAEAALGLYKDAVGNAVRISALPHQVVALFNDEELSFELGRRLLAIRKCVGVNAMRRNAEIIRLSGMQLSNEVILAVLAGAPIPAQDPVVSIKLVSRKTGSHLRIESDHMTELVKYIDEIQSYCEDRLNPYLRALLLSLETSAGRRRKA
jgi:hypothetical protein